MIEISKISGFIILVDSKYYYRSIEIKSKRLTLCQDIFQATNFISIHEAEESLEYIKKLTSAKNLATISIREAIQIELKSKV